MRNSTGEDDKYTAAGLGSGQQAAMHQLHEQTFILDVCKVQMQGGEMLFREQRIDKNGMTSAQEQQFSWCNATVGCTCVLQKSLGPLPREMTLFQNKQLGLTGNTSLGA